ILQNGSDIALRQAIIRGEERELEVPHISMAGLQSQGGRPEQEREGANCDERQRSFHLRPRRPHVKWCSRIRLTPRNSNKRDEHAKKMYVVINPVLANVALSLSFGSVLLV